MEYTIILITLSFVLSLLTNYVFHQIFLKRKKIDPINSRSSHVVIATKSGGVAIFTSLSIITAFLYASNNEIFDFSLLLPLGIIFFIGVYDDFYNADFKLKFFLQIIVAKLLIDQGFLINNFHGLFGFYEIPHLLAQLVTVFTFVVIVNAINFSDGIDGLAVSLVIYFLITLEILMGKSELVYLNGIIVVLILPFYLFNSKKNNKVFLGDAGSLLLGTIIAINIFNFLNHNNSNESFYNPILVAFSLLFYPLIDLLKVFITRIIEGKSPFVADKNHLHHKLSSLFQNHYSRSFFIIFCCLLLILVFLVFEYYFSTIYSFVLFLIITLIIIFKK